MSISVCLASYNGAKFIELQLESIIKQLHHDDEIIIVDDCSSDNTLEIIMSINDERVKIFLNEINRGHVFSFGRSISLATKDIIFMSDQDDIWIDGRVALMKSKLVNSDAMLVSTNSNFVDSKGGKIDFNIDGVDSKFSDKNLSNIIDILKGKENYYGCAMALKKELKALILPIPDYVESHDLWIATAANIIKSNLHCDEVTLNRRVHGANASIVKRKLYLKLWSRIIFLRSILQLFFRKLSIKRKDE
ncbi:glycosyltransferase [Flavobacterium sp. GSP27]|uniref:glycosyltransferase n=1 Tax=Flavobacterium sp. GSP27 TaxID=2497489 RepID=UPI000F83CCD4|nr:glycosyltransferase [Flavobacterium sp. GSP27]RTZ07235.1 glycosyltransferase [Flavobacterium sp. GSP27]